jgi:hypothetical protein
MINSKASSRKQTEVFGMTDIKPFLSHNISSVMSHLALQEGMLKTHLLEDV